MDLITSLHSFLRVSETGSFSAVAAERGVTQPAISRQVSALEEYLGARLVQRSTQAVTLTDEGRNLLAPARDLVEAAEGLRNLADQWLRKPVGLVRLAVPAPLGVHVAGHISTLLAQYEELSIELIMRDRPGNLVEEGFDLEVRLGEIEDASLICRRVGSTTRHIVASPEYIDRNLPILHPLDLALHHCIVHPRYGREDVWHFTDLCDAGERGAAEHAVTVRGRFSADNPAAIQTAVLKGHGVACLSHLVVQEDIEAGRLRRLLPQFEFRRQPLYITYAPGRRLAYRTRAVIDFLVRVFQSDPLMKLGSPPGSPPANHVC
ncbi:LysR family transcriptional regulator [Acuticoccus sediminis]|uniref:LysR family transcriptional regulator n=1 Tax=Acuticoccus sediminis TaxID=2184697 RepID=A0A8B2NKL2_9HYPH|nr:LysR family transcriptional regulator [Acuticoccus sediminis]RAH96388.1 LysR family transcriptional regulator [Acuticoccus sediminis]